MAHFALLDENNIVQAVFYGDGDENEITARTGQTYKQTSFNTKAGVYFEYKNGTYQPADDQSKAFRGNYAGLGYKYDESLDAFIPPQNFPSWTLNITKFIWEPPVAPPELTEQEIADSKRHRWDEENQTWVKNQFNASSGEWEDI